MSARYVLHCSFAARLTSSTYIVLHHQNPLLALFFEFSILRYFEKGSFAIVSFNWLFIRNISACHQWLLPMLCVLLWRAEPSQRVGTYPATRSPPHSGPGLRIRRVKVRKLVRWDKGSSIGKAKAEHTSEAKQNKVFIRYFSSAVVNKNLFSRFPGSKDLSHVTVTLEDKCHDHGCPHFFLLSLSFYGWAHHMARDVPLVCSGDLSPLCPLPTPCPPSA